MPRRTALAAVSAAVVSAALLGAAPAQEDPLTDEFLRSIAGVGLDGIDPVRAADLGRQVCPMLAQPGQDLANVAAGVAEGIGAPLGPATIFTGVAISVFCPGAVSALADGRSPLPLGLLGAF